MNNFSKSIAIDVDNVLADTHGNFCKRASKEWHEKVTPSMITHAKIIGSFPKHNGDTWRILENVWENWKDLPLMEENAGDIIGDLMKQGCKVVIATSRTYRSIPYVDSWLKENKIQSNEFRRMKFHEPKASLDVDLLVDDDPKQIEEFAETPKQMLRTGLIFDQPWNRNVPSTKRIFRIKSLREIVGYL